ncbi:MAG: 4-hydroxy-tetrahydrodipicolinate reductase [Bacillota bacterium]
MKVLLHGANGRMGQVMTRIISAVPDMEVICGVDIAPDRLKNPYPVYECLECVKEHPDVLIDFSNHACLDAILCYGVSRRVPLVICSTGFSAEQKQQMVEASKQVALLHSANMSLGINLVLSLVRQAAMLLSDSFDIEIVERHHNQKVDAPSGTALMIADAMNSGLENSLRYVFGRHTKHDKRQKKELGIHAVRGGAIVGQHDVIFAGQGEVIEISHQALSRDVFAHGAISAARFIIRKSPGFYTMKDVVEDAG